jgi:hypothetical protein
MRCWLRFGTLDFDPSSLDLKHEPVAAKLTFDFAHDERCDTTLTATTPPPA